MVKPTVLTVLLGLCMVYAQKFDNLALTPPMGWNSWNTFGCDVDEDLIKEIADALVSSGMQAAGYEYIVVDDCWQIGRDSQGNIIVDPDRFPSGMKAIGDYLHARGLKFGLYSDAGTNTCQGRPGSRGHEYQDARTYAAWGVDYVKYDWCYTGTQDPQASYTTMRDALYAAGRPVVFSMCEWGLSQPWEWATDIAHLWRTTGDIQANWAVPDARQGKVWGGGVIINLDMQEGLERHAGPGHWNDPDMLQVGNGTLTESENRAHLSLWCMLAAPLMAGNDLRNMEKATLEILTNREVIAIDQDSLGRQGHKIKDDGEFEIYMKPLAGGDVAICLFNRHNKPLAVDFDWKEVGIRRKYRLRDLWKQQEVGDTHKRFKARIPAHDVVMLRLLQD